MASGVEKLVYSSLGLKIAASVARAMPPRIGYAVARLVARLVSSPRDSALVRAVRSNQQVVAGGRAPAGCLDERVRVVFWHSAGSVYELYHYMRDAAAVERLYVIDPSFQPLLERPEFAQRGLLIAGLHMAGFDLGLRWLCRYRFKPLILTMPDPQEGRRLELEARRQMQMNVLPASMSAVRQAVRHLQRGGMLLTGIDHPVPRTEPQPCFLGRPAALPTDHIYLALRADVPVTVVASRLETDGKYHVYASPPILMDRHPDRLVELRLNAEKLLSVAARFIQAAPEQWLIFQPVWPG